MIADSLSFISLASAWVLLNTRSLWIDSATWPLVHTSAATDPTLR